MIDYQHCRDCGSSYTMFDLIEAYSHNGLDLPKDVSERHCIDCNRLVYAVTVRDRESPQYIADDTEEALEARDHEDIGLEQCDKCGGSDYMITGRSVRCMECGALYSIVLERTYEVVF